MHFAMLLVVCLLGHFLTILQQARKVYDTVEAEKTESTVADPVTAMPAQPPRGRDNTGGGTPSTDATMTAGKV